MIPVNKAILKKHVLLLGDSIKTFVRFVVNVYDVIPVMNKLEKCLLVFDHSMLYLKQFSSQKQVRVMNTPLHPTFVL